MAATSARTITTTYSGDVVGTESQTAASNGSSPAVIQKVDLSSGNNQVTVPPGGGTTLAGVTIVPPVGNAIGLTLKGLSADTGIAIHLTDPTSLGLSTGVTMINIGAAGAINGVRLFWT